MKALSVTELTSQIKQQLETRFSFIYVQGEISNIKLQISGHYYFTLKDAGAQISCVLFKGQTKSLSRPPKEGDQVVLQGEISVYAPRGNYQLIVKAIEYVGIGTLLMQLHLLKEKLQAEGLFAESRKKKLPRFPKTIGVITSPTGAVIQDILHVLERRSKGFQLILNPVRVQGEGAAQEIAQAIEQCNKHNLCDILIVGRGGGSLEDLWAFNEEVVIRAIAASTIPIISAVGHETDICLSDFAADIRAPTPSAAAEICTAEQTQQLIFLDRTHSQLQRTMQVRLQNHRKQLHHVVKHPHIASAHHLLSSRWQDMDEKSQRIDLTMNNFLSHNTLKLLSKKKQASALNPASQILMFQEKFSNYSKNMKTAFLLQMQKKHSLVERKTLQHRIDQKIKSDLHIKKEGYQRLVSHLSTVNPKNLLTKGYCILFSEKKDSVILKAQDVANNQRLHVLLQDGELQVKVEYNT
ncbi:MAG: exodeoxyribonuclease VII large subunit [Chlamydiia bacterium]